ncbi:MAG: hypothetical protein HKL96_12335 [Phycisphaerales bacterium]|nr:hypothetical protein [Phycisphaerales bacterium]
MKPVGSKPRIIVSGILFWYPLAGVTWQFLHFMLGLRRLGYDPVYIEDSSRWVYNPMLGDSTPDAEYNVSRVAPVLEQFGLKNRWAFRGRYEGGRCWGLSEAQMGDLYQSADVMLNVTGAQELLSEHARCPVRIYWETDPVVSQIQVERGDAAVIAALDGHTHHFTYGENIGQSDCPLSAARYQWRPTRQPVVLDLWKQPFDAGAHSYNTIATWQNRGRDIVYRGETYYWSKDREFLKFVDLPHRVAARFELAAGVDDVTRSLLHSHGWLLADPVHISSDMDRYRAYIREARGEFSVAKDQNIRLRSGWFSDRSACYLAAGRPVINQDTGFSRHLPTGRGLFAFSTMEEIIAAVEAVESDYAAHCHAAFEIAQAYFSAEKVLSDALKQVGLE